MEREYFAHYRKEDHTYQTLEEHIRNTANLSRDYCSIDLLKKAAWLAGFYHDIGKGRKEWQEYFERAVADEERKGGEKLDHSTLGGIAAEKMMPNSLLAEMIEIAIYNHHGIGDSVSVQDGAAQVWKRRSKYSFSDASGHTASQKNSAMDHTYTQVEEAVLQLKTYAGDIHLEEYWKKARIDLDKLGKQIFALTQMGGKTNQYGNKQFFLGMCERMLFSSLMDGDFRDTADFMNHQETISGLNEQALQQIWEQGLWNLERMLEGFEKKERIDICRTMISQQCKDAAVRNDKLYRLSVPTGAGKTLSSLRFALHCAKHKKKRHIFYVAPFRSILEQNADVIRSVLGLENMVLEHHSDVICEDEAQMERYERLIENWDEVPVIVTTAVQFFNTLFRARKSNLRRLLWSSIFVTLAAKKYHAPVTHLPSLDVG